MSLVDIINFDEALVLLGLYEQEVMKTGLLDYPAQWPVPLPSPSPTQPEVVPESAPEAIPKATPEAIAKTPSPAAPEPTHPSITVDNADKVTVIVQEMPLSQSSPSEKTPTVSDEPALMLPNPDQVYDAAQAALLAEQERERRLFYLFVQELEQTGDLRKLPSVLHSPPRA